MTTAITPFTLAVPDTLAASGCTVEVRGTWDAPQFNIADTVEVLGMGGRNAVRNVIRRLGITPSLHFQKVQTPKGGRPRGYDNAYCTEAEWYEILITSGKAAARPFVTWVTSQVLPSIRLHGCYPPPANPAPALRPWSYRFTISPEMNAHRLLVRREYRNRWTVPVALLTEMVLLEGELIACGFPLRVSDLPDGSAGLCYANYRRGKPWARAVEKSVPLVLPAGGSRVRPQPVYPNAYLWEERTHFDEWFEEVYAPANLPTYLDRKARRMPPGERPAAIEAAAKVRHRLALAGPCGERQGQLPFGEGV